MIGLDSGARIAPDGSMKPICAAFILTALALLAGCATAPEPARTLTAIACQLPPGFHKAVLANKQSLTDPTWAPFGRPETGWSVYAFRAAHDIKTHCAPKTPGFASRLARWQTRHALPPTGRMDKTTFQSMKTVWQTERPFVVLRAAGVCPDPPADADLTMLPASETLDGRAVQLRADAAKALETMVDAAKRDLAAEALPPDRLTVFSGFRSPAYDAERCARDGNCDGVGRATCSAHRTGLAVDLMLGAAPGFEVDSTQDANRFWQTKTPAYRWLIDNAGRYGFTNYAYEPWHWEWKQSTQ
jgi:LAS superfamily LD-carboxypeptidase LdcB